MTPQASYVSVIDPIGPAIERVRTVLFRPFDLGKWFVIGFSAWLANLGQGGGGGGSGGGGGPHIRYRRPDVEIKEAVYNVKDFVAANLEWIIPVAIMLFVLAVAVVLFVTWVSSRGRFTFLYCVAQNKAEFWNPWHQFRDHGNSLFVFRIVLTIIGFFIVVSFLLVGGTIFVTSAARFGVTVLSIMGIVGFGLLFFGLMIVLGLVGKFTKDFVVPIMYLRTASCVQAWRILLDLMGFNKARFFIYVLFQIVIGLAIGAMLMATVCVTCCCAGCVFIVPYIGTVALLPILVFKRSYPLYYLEQYGPEFRVIAPERPVMAPPAEPMV